MDTITAIKFASDFYQFKSKKEAQKRYEKAMSYYENETYMNGETKRVAINAIQLAAGIEGKEEG
jgi:hypothetical protein